MRDLEQRIHTIEELISAIKKIEILQEFKR